MILSKVSVMSRSVMCKKLLSCSVMCKKYLSDSQTMSKRGVIHTANFTFSLVVFFSLMSFTTRSSS